MSDNSSDLINEYKDQVRILKQEVAELQDAGKSKDSANKRCLQKLEHSNKDLEIANEKIKEMKNEILFIYDLMLFNGRRVYDTSQNAYYL
jgi:peptidoglycan hydrolase CwlO-like protein